MPAIPAHIMRKKFAILLIVHEVKIQQKHIAFSPPAPQNAQPGLEVPPPYNHQPSESDRRRSNLRARSDDERTGPKNKYGRQELIICCWFIQ